MNYYDCFAIILVLSFIYFMSVGETTRSKKNIPPPSNLEEIIIDAFTDVLGKKIQGAGLTPLTTPLRRPVQHLNLGNEQEIHNL